MQCVNCNNPYVLEHGKKQRLPLLLNCSHGYCSVCITALLRRVQSDAIPCPECRIPTPLSPNISILSQLHLCVYTVGRIRVEQLGLIQDSSHHGNAASAGPQLDRHLEENDEDEEDSKLKIIRSLGCEECESKMAEVKCEKCDALFCNKCFEMVHLSSKILRSHKGTRLDDGEAPEDFKELVKTAKQKILLLNKLKTSKHSQDEIDQKTILNNLRVTLHQKLETEFHKVLKTYEEKRSNIERNWVNIKKEATSLEKRMNSIINKASYINPKDFRRDLEEMIDKASELLTASSSVSREIVKIVKTGPALDIDLSRHLTVEQTLEPVTLEPVTVIAPSSDSECESSPCSSVTPTKRDFLTPSKPRYSSSRNSSYSSRGSSSSRGASPGFLEQISPTKEDLQNAVGCYVTHVESPSEFWVILDSDQLKIDTLNKFLQKHCESHKENATMKEGIICAVKNKNGDWKRALIEKVIWASPAHLYVHFLDEGGITQMVIMSDSRSIPQKWQSMKPLARRCCLSGIRPVSRMSNLVPDDWSQNSNSYLRSTVLDQRGIKLKIISRNQCTQTNTETLMVDLYLPSTKSAVGISVIGQLIAQGRAEKIKEKPLVPSNLPIGPVPPVGHQMEVEMVTADSPNDFYVLDAINDDPTLNRICEMVYTHISNKPEKVAQARLTVGALVLAPYEEKYYRAKILDIKSDDCVSVRYLDYGNVSIVNVADIYEITKKLMKMPPVSYNCRLNSSVEEWPETICNKFYQMTEGEKLMMTVTGSMKNGILPVNLQFKNNKEDICKQLEDQLSKEHTPLPSSSKMDEGCPPAPVLPPLGYSGSIVIKNVVSPLEFHVILAENMEIFERIEDCPPVTTMEPFHPVQGSYCHALFGSKYHRAVVTFVSEDGLTCVIYYIDYGNTESVPLMNLLPLPDSLVSEPALAIPCCLYGIEEGTEFDYTQNIEFYKLVFEQTATASVKDILECSPTSKMVISLIIQDDAGYHDVLQVCTSSLSSSTPSVATSMSMPEVITSPIIMTSTPPPESPGLPSHFLSDPTPDSTDTTTTTTNIASPLAPPPGLSKFTYSKPEYPPGEEFEMMVTFITPDNVIYGQPLPYAQLLEEVIDSILMFTKVPHPVSSLSVLSKGQGCIALYEEDQQWYRGVIENINTDYAEVLFIDFGNEAQCPPHNIINKMACPSIPRLAISFSDYKHLGKERLKKLVDTEILVTQSDGYKKLVLDEVSSTPSSQSS